MPILMLINVCLLNKIARMGFIWIGFLDRPPLPMKCWIIWKWKEKLFVDPATRCVKDVQPMDFIKKFVWNVIACNNKTSALKNVQQIIILDLTVIVCLAILNVENHAEVQLPMIATVV
jgi:hypothetical protein